MPPFPTSHIGHELRLVDVEEDVQNADGPGGGVQIVQADP